MLVISEFQVTSQQAETSQQLEIYVAETSLLPVSSAHRVILLLETSLLLETLQEMYRDWPFFRNLLSNAQMALSKSNMDIASEYASLCVDPETSQRVYGLIASEYQLAVEWILNVADSDKLLSENPLLADSLHRRDAYLGPLNYLQVFLLSKVREIDSNNPVESPWMKPLLRSINAIAAGMRNTG